MQLSDKQKYEIIFLFEQGMSQREIATKLGIGQSTVSRNLKKYHEFNSINHAGGNGRKPAVDSKISACINANLEKNSKISLRKLSAKVENETQTKITHVTIKNFLNCNGLYAYPPISKPYLTKRHIDIRFEAAKRIMFMSNEEVKQTIFSDESKFNLHFSDGKVSVWREPGTGLKPEHLQKTFKHGGGSVMVWGCFSYHGVGNLEFIEGTMDSAKYVDILSRNLRSSATNMGLKSFVFQQDNDPKHKAKLTNQFFEAKNIQVMDWPPQSPDLNPIENLWGSMKEAIAEKEPKNLRELKVIITDEWNKISVETCKKLALSFKKRALAIYKAAGGHINY